MTREEIFDCASYLYDGGWRACDKKSFISEHPEHTDEEVEKIMDKLFAFELEEKLCYEFGISDDDIIHLCKILDEPYFMDVLTCDMSFSDLDADSIRKFLRDFKECFFS